LTCPNVLLRAILSLCPFNRCYINTELRPKLMRAVRRKKISPALPFDLMSIECRETGADPSLYRYRFQSWSRPHSRLFSWAAAMRSRTPLSPWSILTAGNRRGRAVPGCPVASGDLQGTRKDTTLPPRFVRMSGIKLYPFKAAIAARRELVRVRARLRTRVNSGLSGAKA
jgi:hypothetical protein